MLSASVRPLGRRSIERAALSSLVDDPHFRFSLVPRCDPRCGTSPTLSGSMGFGFWDGSVAELLTNPTPSLHWAVCFKELSHGQCNVQRDRAAAGAPEHLAGVAVFTCRRSSLAVRFSLVPRSDPVLATERRLRYGVPLASAFGTRASRSSYGTRRLRSRAQTFWVAIR